MSGRRSPAADAANEEDRGYFAAHPDHECRVRPYIPGEFGDLQFQMPPEAVLVLEIVPGLRRRIPLSRGLLGLDTRH